MHQGPRVPPPLVSNFDLHPICKSTTVIIQEKWYSIFLISSIKQMSSHLCTYTIFLIVGVYGVSLYVHLLRDLSFSYCTYFGSVKIVQSCLCRFYFAQPRVLATNFHSHSCFRYYLIRHVIVLVFHQPSFYFQGLGKMGLLKRPVGQIAHFQNSIFLSCHFWVNFKTVIKH